MRKTEDEKIEGSGVLEEVSAEETDLQGSTPLGLSEVSVEIEAAQALAAECEQPPPVVAIPATHPHINREPMPGQPAGSGIMTALSVPKVEAEV